MQNANYPSKADSDINDLLKMWDTPTLPVALDQRVLASYRQQVHRIPFWRRFFTASIRIPVPLVAAAVILMACLSGFAVLWLRGAAPEQQTVAQPFASPAPAAKKEIAPTTSKEIVQVPVVRERVVTRVVYVTKKASPLDAVQPMAAPSSNEIKLASHVSGDNAYTNIDLAGYQPVEEMKVRIIKGSATNEH